MEADMTDSNDINQLNDEASPKDDDDIIDLTDIVSGTEDIDDIEFSDYKDEATSASEEEKIPELDDDILGDPDKDIEIDHYLDDEIVDSADLDSESDVSKDLSLEPEEESYELGQLIADVVENTQQEAATPSDTPEPITLSTEQVDEALERVIKKMYADKIDSMLTEVIEKTVTKEIERLKDLLMEDTRITEE
jgi:hypothetical protein